MEEIDSKVIKKLELLIRQKIYKEILEEKEKYKTQKFQTNTKGYLLPKNKTQGSQGEAKNGRYSPNNQQQQPIPKKLAHASTFLPVITNKKIKPNKDVNEGGQATNSTSYSKEYMKYLKRREQAQKKFSNSSKFNNQQQETDVNSNKKANNGQPTNIEESELEKMYSYLRKSENIIKKLIKNKSKIAHNDQNNQTTANKPEVQKNSQKPLASRSFRIHQQPKQVSKSFVVKDYSFSDLPSKTSDESKSSTQSIRNSQIKQSELANSLYLPSHKKQQQMNEFINPRQKARARLKAFTRQNNHKITAIAQENAEKQEGKEQDNQKSELNTRKSRANTRNKPTEANKAKDKKATQKNPKQKNQQKKGSNQQNKQKEPDDPQYQQKKQDATIKYLKKLRECGGQLYQKVQSHKKSGEEEVQGNKQQNPAPK